MVVVIKVNVLSAHTVKGLVTRGIGVTNCIGNLLAMAILPSHSPDTAHQMASHFSYHTDR